MSKDNGRPTTTWELITPEIAGKMLESMDGNRPVNQRRVDHMAEDIKAGKWAENGETIIVDAEGRLIDGQHRCWAVVSAGVPIRSAVVRGVDHAVFSSIDQGRYRTDADILSIAHKGIISPKMIAATLRLVMWWEAGYKQPKDRPGDDDKGRLLAIFDRHKRVPESVEFCGGSRFNRLLRPSVACFAHYIGRRFGAEHEPDAFWLSVADGEGLHRGDPAYALREYLRRRHGDPTSTNRIGGARFTSFLEAEVCIRAWNAHCESVPLQNMQVGERVPEPWGSPRFNRRRDVGAGALAKASAIKRSSSA